MDGPRRAARAVQRPATIARPPSAAQCAVVPCQLLQKHEREALAWVEVDDPVIPTHARLFAIFDRIYTL